MLVQLTAAMSLQAAAATPFRPQRRAGKRPVHGGEKRGQYDVHA